MERDQLDMIGAAISPAYTHARVYWVRVFCGLNYMLGKSERPIEPCIPPGEVGYAWYMIGFGTNGALEKLFLKIQTR